MELDWSGIGYSHVRTCTDVTHAQLLASTGSIEIWRNRNRDRSGSCWSALDSSIEARTWAQYLDRISHTLLKSSTWQWIGGSIDSVLEEEVSIHCFEVLIILDFCVVNKGRVWVQAYQLVDPPRLMWVAPVSMQPLEGPRGRMILSQTALGWLTWPCLHKWFNCNGMLWIPSRWGPWKQPGSPLNFLQQVHFSIPPPVQMEDV